MRVMDMLRMKRTMMVTAVTALLAVSTTPVLGAKGGNGRGKRPATSAPVRTAVWQPDHYVGSDGRVYVYAFLHDDRFAAFTPIDGKLIEFVRPTGVADPERVMCSGVTATQVVTGAAGSTNALPGYAQCAVDVRDTALVAAAGFIARFAGDTEYAASSTSKSGHLYGVL